MPRSIKSILKPSIAGEKPWSKEHFSTKLSLDVEEYTADHLKDQIPCGLAQGIVRHDLDPKRGAFFINSLYLIVVASVVSKHFQNRSKEHFEIQGSLKGRTVEESLSKVITEIHRFLRP